MVRMAWLLVSMNRYAAHDSIVRILEGLGEGLTPYERAEVQSHRAVADGDPRGNEAALRRASELAPNSLATSNLASFLSANNRPREAVELLRSMNPERKWLRESSGYWERQYRALMMLEEHEEALEVVVNARRFLARPGGIWLRWHADVLAAMGQAEDLRTVLDEIEATYPEATMAFVEPLEVLHAYGYDDVLRENAARVLEYFEARPESETTRASHRHSYGRALYLAGRLDEAQRVYDQLLEEHPGNAMQRRTRALFSAVRGDTVQARADLEWFEAREVGEWDEPVALRQRAQILGALGDHEGAMELIRQSYQHPRRRFDHMDRLSLNMDPLRDHQPFKDFMKPRG
jgi:tetratricopeptide (TPR) repeat protein